MGKISKLKFLLIVLKNDIYKYDPFSAIENHFEIIIVIYYIINKGICSLILREEYVNRPKREEDGERESFTKRTFIVCTVHLI